MQQHTIHAIVQDSPYNLLLFSKEQIQSLERRIYHKANKDNKAFVKCLVRKKDIQLKPEEVIRQLMLEKLITEYEYPKELLQVEYTVNFGREKKFADWTCITKVDT